MQDSKHELDGTCFVHIITEDGFGESQLRPFSTGINVGAEFLRVEMDFLIERSGGDAEACTHIQQVGTKRYRAIAILKVNADDREQ